MWVFVLCLILEIEIIGDDGWGVILVDNDVLVGMFVFDYFFFFEFSFWIFLFDFFFWLVDLYI